MDGAYAGMTAEYCRTACGGKRCAICPMPKLLPDAQPGIAAYMAVATQWRHGFGGRTGLDYTACRGTLRVQLPRWRRQSPAAFDGLTLADVMDDVQVIEAAMLGADHERREEEDAKRKAEQTN